MTAYYNENDEEKVAWIRELIRENVVAPGEVDERSITEVRADDLRGFTQCHFFAGIAVWSYALRLAGWPDDRPVWTGSCPCPSFSCAGKGEGFDDARNLWPIWFPLISESRPAEIFGEQSADAIGYGWWDLVSTDMESQAYAAAPAVLSSASVGGTDIRHRLYFVARLADAYERRSQQCDARQREIQQHRARHETLRMAHPETRGRGMLRSASGSSGHAESCVETSWLANSASARCTRPEDSRATASDAGERPRSSEFERESSVSGMAHPEHHGRDQAHRLETVPHRDEPRLGLFERDCAESRMADANGGEPGLGRIQRSGEHGLFAQDSGVSDRHPFADALKGFWGTADWLFCTDGRWRPVEAGTFPLGDGSAFRLGRLRGYGDAINAEVAKAFIQAAEEAKTYQ